MAGYITTKNRQQFTWYVGTPLPKSVKANAESFQVDGDELTYVLEVLFLDRNDHNPRVQTFMGTAMRAAIHHIPETTP